MQELKKFKPMSNIIQFRDSTTPDDDLINYMNRDGDIGVTNIDKKIAVIRLNKNEFTVITPDGEQFYNRKELAEFLWFAAIFIDSEERWRKDGEMVSCNY